MKKKDSDRPATDRAREPQSYGSERDWVSGHTDQEVGGTQSKVSRHDEAFYEERNHGERSPGHQGGQISEIQLQDGSDRQAASGSTKDTADQPGWKVSDSSSGRSSYWRRRDYD